MKKYYHAKSKPSSGPEKGPSGTKPSIPEERTYLGYLIEYCHANLKTLPEPEKSPFGSETKEITYWTHEFNFKRKFFESGYSLEIYPKDPETKEEIAMRRSIDLHFQQKILPADNNFKSVLCVGYGSNPTELDLCKEKYHEAKIYGSELQPDLRKEADERYDEDTRVIPDFGFTDETKFDLIVMRHMHPGSDQVNKEHFDEYVAELKENGLLVVTNYFHDEHEEVLQRSQENPSLKSVKIGKSAVKRKRDQLAYIEGHRFGRDMYYTIHQKVAPPASRFPKFVEFLSASCKEPDSVEWADSVKWAD